MGALADEVVERRADEDGDRRWAEPVADIIAEHLADDELERLLAASDFVVLPLRAVTTSSTVALALTAGVPVVLPESVVLQSEPVGAVIRYDGSVDGLTEALRRAAIMTNDDVLAIARAATFAAPRRSLVVAFVTAEESGLLGSKHLAQHPPVPASRIAADINIDSVNRWGRTTSLAMLGLGKSSLDEVVRAAAREQGRTVHGDPHPDRGAFYRSDQFSLAVMAYEMLTGGLPFNGNTAWEWATAHMTAQPRPLETFPVSARIPPAMKAAILRGLEKDPLRRPQTVTEFFNMFSTGAGAWSGATPRARARAAAAWASASRARSTRSGPSCGRSSTPARPTTPGSGSRAPS